MEDVNETRQDVHPVTRAIITGASGFIGRTLVRHLLARRAEVIAIDHIPVTLSCESHVADLTISSSLDSLLDERTVVFHMAARADVGSSVTDPRGDFMNNVLATFEILESVRKAGCRLVYPSTASIFDSMDELPLRETAYVKPTSPYGAGKVAGEAYCAAYHRSYNCDIRVARMFSVYGVGMNRFVIWDLIDKIQRDPRRIEIRGDGEQIRDYLYIDDAVRGLVDIAEHGSAGQDYNLASGAPVRLLDLAHKIATLMGHPEIEIVPTGEPSPGDVPKWYADISKITNIGFITQVSLDEGLLRTIRYLSEAQSSTGCVG
jgi:nucleoside-diphosphate-sugar epimerase